MSGQLVASLRRLEVVRLRELRCEWTELPAWVFCTEAGTPLDESRVRNAFARALRAAKLPSVVTCGNAANFPASTVSVPVFESPRAFASHITALAG